MTIFFFHQVVLVDEDDDEDDPTQGVVILWLSKRIPLIASYDEKGRFFVQVEKGEGKIIEETTVIGRSRISISESSDVSEGLPTARAMTSVFLNCIFSCS